MRLYSLTTLSTGLSILETLKDHLHGVIGLTTREPDDSISGFMNMEQWCYTNNIKFIGITDYSLKSEADKQTLLNLSVDIILVNGWQRLIPEWLIQHCELGALGVHGSAYGITRGRGRSPQNWALLMGKKEFSVSLFKIDKGIDSGAVIATKKFQYTDFDDIKTSYYKVNDCISEMILNILDNNCSDLGLSTIQNEQPQYLPQRTPEDGEIDWSRTSKEIHDFIRALTLPYPCAYSLRDSSGKLTVISGRPYSKFASNGEYGKILRQFSGGELLISTGDGSYLIDSYKAQGGSLQQGEKLVSANFKKQLQAIIKRHNDRFPEHPLADELLEMAGLKNEFGR